LHTAARQARTAPQFADQRKEFSAQILTQLGDSALDQALAGLLKVELRAPQWEGW
jgi:hypothetical protein